MTDRTTKINLPIYTSLTIPVGTSTHTTGVDLGNTTLVGIITPAEFDGTTMTITAAATLAGTYYPVAASNAASTAYTITTAASIFTPISDAVSKGLRFIKITTGTGQTTTDTILVLVTRRIQ